MERPPGRGERRPQLSAPPQRQQPPPPNKGAARRRQPQRTACAEGASPPGGHSPPPHPPSDGPGCPAERALQRAPYPERNGGERGRGAAAEQMEALGGGRGGAGKGRGEPL